MLTLEREQTTLPLDYANLNTSIQETFTAIDRFEWQAIEELGIMRDNAYYKEAGQDDHFFNSKLGWGAIAVRITAVMNLLLTFG